MIIVEHFLFFCCHHIRVDGIEIHRNKSDWLEIHELAVLVLLAFTSEKFVLQTDTVASFNIDTRLVCDNHAFFKWLDFTCAELPSETCRTFVDVQKVSDSVTGSVIEV